MQGEAETEMQPIRKRIKSQSEAVKVSPYFPLSFSIQVHRSTKVFDNRRV